MFLTLKVMLALAGTEALPDYQRVQVLARRLTPEMTCDQVCDRLRLHNHLLLPSGSLHSVTHFVPLQGQKSLNLHFVFEWKGPDKEMPMLLRGLTLRDKNGKSIVDLKYEPKK